MSFRTRCGGQTYEDQKVLNLLLPCFTSRFILSFLRLEQHGKRVPFNLWEGILRWVAQFHWFKLDTSVSIALFAPGISK